jgi:hypothetical protein
MNNLGEGGSIRLATPGWLPVRGSSGFYFCCLLILGWAAIPAKAQPFVLSRGTDQPAGGLRLYAISGYAGYDTLPPFATNQPRLPLSSQIDVGAVASVGWSVSGPASRLSVTYTPSYNARPGYSQGNSFNQGLNVDYSTKLSARWNFRIGATGQYSSLEQSLFQPTALATVVEVPSSFADLASAVSASKYTNNPIASILTGGPVVDSPARTILYGDRILSIGLASGITYSASPRLLISASVSATRTQGVPRDNPDAIMQAQVFLSRSTSGTGGIGMSYALSPRTSFGLEGSSTRTFSKFVETYASGASASLSRTLTPRLFAGISGGVGTITPVHQTGTLLQGPAYSAGGSLGFKTLAHTFVASYGRSISDPYGLGAQSGQYITGSWNWAPPRARWYLQASATRQSFEAGGVLNQLSGWMGQAAFGRTLSSQFNLSVQYAYLDTHGAAFISSNLSDAVIRQSVRLSLTWVPTQTPWFVR